MEHGVTDVRIRAGRNWQEILARAGLIAKGVSYALVGVLAIGVALGVGGKATSQTGALHALAGNLFGAIVIGLLAAGLAAYALWRLWQAFYVDEWGERIACIARVLIYSALAYSGARILAGAGGQSQNQKAHKAAAVVLGWPGGPEIVGAAGALFFGVGCWQLYSGLSRRFEDKWHGQSDIGRIAGVVGHCARFVVMALIGAFTIKAAVDYNPQDAVGLDGALQKLAHQSYGPFLLGVTAAGLIAYAIFCFFDARYRDVTK